MDPIKFDLKGLRSLGYAVLDITTSDYEAEKDVFKFMMVPAKKQIYSKTIKELLGIALPEEVAQDIMEEIYRHKWIESEKAKHDIGMEKAAKDWHEKHFKEWSHSREKKQ